MPRREFLKVVGAASAAPLWGALPALAGPAAPAAAAPSHFVPAEKNLPREWVRGLHSRGSPRAWRGKELDTVGMPIGGIAAGQLYLRGDGTLGVWQVFNRHHFSGYGAENYKYRTPDSPVEQGFEVAVAEEPGGKAAVLGLDRKDFPAVEFLGEHPVARLVYAREGFPLRVEMEAFSPFIPLNAQDSALPATLFHVTLENVSGRELHASVRGFLENAVCFHSAPEVTGYRTSRVVKEKGRTLLLHAAEEAPAAEKPPARPRVLLADFEGGSYKDWKATGEAFGSKPAEGTLPRQQEVSGFEGKGLVNSFLGGDGPHGTLASPPFVISRRYLNFLIGGGGHAGETCLNLIVDGQVVRTATGKNVEKLEWGSFRVADLEGKTARIEVADRHSGGWGHINVDTIELADERAAGPRGPIEKLEDFGTMVLALAEAGTSREEEARYPLGERRRGEVETARVPLGPGAKRTFTFVLAWHFPNHERGNYYAVRFHDAEEVAHHVLDHEVQLSGETRRWRDAFYRESTLPWWLLQRLHSTASNLATGTCQWWGDGRFWAWEGVGCCHGTCTHVWNYAHALARLFPELERIVRERQDLGAALHPDGLVGFRGERNGHGAADGQAGTVLKCYREHLMSADLGFLKRNWPDIKKVLERSVRDDGDEDGLIEGSQHNTFDINFEGPNTFVGSLYLAALRAGEEMAREVGDLEFAGRLRRIFEAGSRASTGKLWNGEYFIQVVDLKRHPRDQYGEGCLADQLFGQGWAHQVGLGHLYDKEKVLLALRSIWRYNWAPDIGPQNAAHKPERWFAVPGEAGLFTCTWPRSAYLPEGVRYREEVWTGIEYQVAGHMVWEGMVEEALAMLRGIHDRYDPLKRNPFNEVECGDHYARALSSWGVYTALLGFEHHGPRGHLGFAPRLTPEDFRAAFTACEGWGVYRQSRSNASQSHEVQLLWGELRLRTLAFALPAGLAPARVQATAPGRAWEPVHRARDGRIEIDLGGEVALRAGEALRVEIG